MSNTVKAPMYKDIYEQINKYLYYSGITINGSSLKAIYYIHMAGLIIMLVLELFYVVSRFSAENFLELTAVAPCIGEGMVTILKFCPAVVLKRHKVFTLIDLFENLYDEIVSDPNKRDLIVQKTVLVQKFTRYYSMMNWILILLFIISSPLMMSYKYLTTGTLRFILPFPIWLPFPYDNWLNWTAVYLFSMYNGLSCVLLYITTDTLYFTLCSQVGCNFAVICKDLRELNADNAHTLKDIIKRHQHILSIGDMLDEIFTFPNWSNVMIGAIHICILGFNIMTDEFLELPKHLVFLVAVLLQIFVMSSFGENIIRESLKVREAAFNCDWLNMKPKEKKMLLIMMTRATKPQQLTAYKFNTISYSSFAKIISTSWSYFTLLRTVYKPSEVSHVE